MPLRRDPARGVAAVTVELRLETTQAREPVALGLIAVAAACLLLDACAAVGPNFERPERAGGVGIHH